MTTGDAHGYPGSPKRPFRESATITPVPTENSIVSQRVHVPGRSLTPITVLDRAESPRQLWIAALVLALAFGAMCLPGRARTQKESRLPVIIPIEGLRILSFSV